MYSREKIQGEGVVRPVRGDEILIGARYVHQTRGGGSCKGRRPAEIGFKENRRTRNFRCVKRTKGDAKVPKAPD